MVPWASLIRAMTAAMSAMASTAPRVSAWMLSTRAVMSWVTFPARAASMVALSASRLVCSAIEMIAATTVAMSVEDSPSLATVVVADSAAPTAWPAIRATSLAFWAISRIEVPISSVPAATVCTLPDTCSAVAATRPVCVADSPANRVMSCAVADSSSVAEASVVELSPMVPSSPRMVAMEASSAVAISPTSSVLVAPVLPRRSPSASPATTARTRRNGPTTDRVTTQPSTASSRTAATPTPIADAIADSRCRRLSAAAADASSPTASPTVGSACSSPSNTVRNCGYPAVAGSVPARVTICCAPPR